MGLFVCVFVGLLSCQLEIACIDPHQTGFVGKGSDHLQLTKFWPSCALGNGVWFRVKKLAPPYYSQCAVFAFLWAFFHFTTKITRHFSSLLIFSYYALQIILIVENYAFSRHCQVSKHVLQWGPHFNLKNLSTKRKHRLNNFKVRF